MFSPFCLDPHSVVIFWEVDQNRLSLGFSLLLILFFLLRACSVSESLSHSLKHKHKHTPLSTGSKSCFSLGGAGGSDCQCIHESCLMTHLCITTRSLMKPIIKDHPKCNQDRRVHHMQSRLKTETKEVLKRERRMV